MAQNIPTQKQLDNWASMRNRVLSEETRARISKSKTGLPKTPAQLAADELAKTRTGANRTPAQLADDKRKSENQTGVSRPHTSPAQLAGHERQRKPHSTPAQLAADEAQRVAKTGSTQSTETVKRRIQTRLVRNGTGEYLDPRQSPEYLLCRSLVLTRDNYTCLLCGITEVMWQEKQRIRGQTRIQSLDIHHIKPWDDYPELRYEVDNCSTLCRDCHNKVEPRLTKAKKKKRIIVLQRPVNGTGILSG